MALSLGGRVNDEKAVDYIGTIEQVKQNLILVDRWMSNLKMAVDCGEFEDERNALAQSRMKLVECLQKVDKLLVGVINEERFNTIGFRPLTLGGNSKEIAKSDSDDLVSRILRGEIKNGRTIAKVLGTKAKNE
jgi:hypothetical protein